MSWRQRTRVLGVLGPICLAAGCLGTSVGTVRPSLDHSPSIPAPTLVGPSTGSPYHAHAPSPVSTVSPTAVERAHYPDAHAPSPPQPIPPSVTTAPPVIEPPPTPAVVLTPPPSQPDEPVVQAFRLLASKGSRPDEALRALQALDPSSREALQTLLPVAAQLGQGGLDQMNPGEVSALIDQLHRLTASMRPRAELTLDKVCFCRRGQTFGAPERLPGKAAFQGGGEGRPGERVQVYVEVRNFCSKPVADHYETTLACSLEVHDARGKQVGIGFEPQLDRSQTLRTDYFMTCAFHIPPKLPPGLYTLWVKVEDLGTPGSRRIARKSLDFEVTGR